jgi:hypothetical protein
VKFAYADPPYLGMGRMYADRHEQALIWDDPETHRELIVRLCDEYPDGWLMSASSTSLRVILPMCPDKTRVLAWCKPWVAFKDKTLAYAWEPVLMQGGRKRTKDQPTQRDYFVGNDPPRINKPAHFVPGMKPRAFCRWIFEVLNAEKGDTLDDLFPGSGAIRFAWSEWTSEQCDEIGGLFHAVECNVPS